MKVERLLAPLRSLPGRLLFAGIGLTVVVFLVHHVGFDVVRAALLRAAPLLPLLFLLEAAIVTCDMLTLRFLYGEDRRRVPLSAFARAGLLGYVVMVLAPAGRAVAEATRAAMLAKHVGGPRAAAAATQMQGVLLFANCIISLCCSLAFYVALGWTMLTFAALANAAGVLLLALIFQLGARKAKLGARVGKRTSTAEAGAAYDALLAGGAVIPLAPVATAIFTRLLQTVQNGVLVVAVGGAFGVLPALLSEGIHLVAATIGDLVPAQLGATEGSFALAAHALGLARGDAMAIALLAHLTQLFWLTIGVLAPLLWNGGPQAEPEAQP